MDRSQLARHRVLLVDQHAETRDITGILLRAHGAIVTPCGSARDALARISSEPFDALVANAGTAYEDACNLITQIRALSPERGGGTPAIAFAAPDSAVDRDDMLAAGFDWHVVKRPDSIALVDAIAGVILGQKMKRRD